MRSGRSCGWEYTDYAESDEQNDESPGHHHRAIVARGEIPLAKALSARELARAARMNVAIVAAFPSLPASQRDPGERLRSARHREWSPPRIR